MYHDTELDQFINLLGSICDAGDSASVVFFNEDGGWGKIAILGGEIDSVRYGNERGATAVRRIKGLSSVRYQLRLEDPNQPPRPLREGFGNTSFFGFFEHAAITSRRTPRPPSAPPNPAWLSAPTPARRTFKILVADDSRVVRKSLVRILMDHGLETVEAGNGFEAIGQLEKETPDLVILDLVMPGLGGNQVIEQMKKDPRFRDLPVLLLTSRDSLFDRLKGKLSNSNEYLTKPVDSELLLKTIRRYLNR